MALGEYMKIVFIGGVKFSHAILETILNENYSVEAVFSYDESKKFFYSDYASFDKITNEHKIKHIKVMNINDEENIEIISEIQPDIIFVMGWSQLLKDKLLEIPTIGVIGSHPTELPKYRGRSPIPWSIIKELKESALTFFYITSGMDDGDILSQKKFQITSNDDATSLYEKMIQLGKKMMSENLPLLKLGFAKRIPQNPLDFIENWPKRTPEDGKIDWSKSAKEIHTLIRASTHPYPGAFTFLHGSKITIWKSSLLECTSEGIGKIMNVDNDRIQVGTGNKVLIINTFSSDDSNLLNAKTKNNMGTFFDK